MIAWRRVGTENHPLPTGRMWCLPKVAGTLMKRR
jgi:hypothetical protein